MKVTFSSSANNTNQTPRWRMSGVYAGSTIIVSLFTIVCTEAARVVVPAFLLVPRLSNNITGGAGASSVSGQGTISETVATFDCTADLADLVASTADDCLKQSSFCLVTAMFRAGQECGVNPNGGNASVMMQQGFLDVASVVASRVVDSQSIQTECLKPTFESAQCSALMQERLNNGGFTVDGMEYIPLSTKSETPERARVPTVTPAPVKIDFVTRSPVAAPIAPIAVAPSTVALITSAPMTSTPTVDSITSAALGTVVGASSLFLFLFCLGCYLCRKQSRSRSSCNSKNNDPEAPVNDRLTTSKTTAPMPPTKIDIENGRFLDETEVDNSESSNRLRQDDVEDESSSLASRSAVNHGHHSAQPQNQFNVVSKKKHDEVGDDHNDDDDDSVPEYDEILSTGSCSLAFTMDSGASSAIYCGSTDTTEFDGDTFKSIESADLMTTIPTIMEQHPAVRAHDSSPTPCGHSQNGTNASDTSSVVSHSSIESEDPEPAMGHRMPQPNSWLTRTDRLVPRMLQPNSWLTRTDRLVPAAKQAAAAATLPETSQADIEASRSAMMTN